MRLFIGSGESSITINCPVCHFLVLISFQNRLETICYGLRESLNSIEGRLKAEHFRQRVVSVFRVWEEWAVYPADLLISLQYIFLGLITGVSGTRLLFSIALDSTRLLGAGEAGGQQEKRRR